MPNQEGARPTKISLQDVYTLYFKHSLEEDRGNTRVRVDRVVSTGEETGDIIVWNPDVEWNAMLRGLPLGKKTYAIVKGVSVGYVVANYDGHILIRLDGMSTDQFIRYTSPQDKLEWDVRMTDMGAGNYAILVVDKETNEDVAVLAFLPGNRELRPGACEGAREEMEEKGYDPFLYNMRYNSEGAALLPPPKRYKE